MDESYKQKYERIDRLAKEAIMQGNEDAIYSQYDSYSTREMKERALERNSRL